MSAEHAPNSVDLILGEIIKEATEAALVKHDLHGEKDVGAVIAQAYKDYATEYVNQEAQGRSGFLKRIKNYHSAKSDRPAPAIEGIHEAVVGRLSEHVLPHTAEKIAKEVAFHTAELANRYLGVDMGRIVLPSAIDYSAHIDAVARRICTGRGAVSRSF